MHRPPLGCPCAGSLDSGQLQGQSLVLQAMAFRHQFNVAHIAKTYSRAPALLLIGDTSNTYVGLPLPFNLAPIGSPTCDLNLNFITLIALATTASGTATSSIPYTMNPGLSGSRLRTQWLSVDATLAVVTSNGLGQSFPYSATTGIRWPQNRVYAYGWGATPPATGTVQNNGLVTGWTH